MDDPRTPQEEGRPPQGEGRPLGPTSASPLRDQHSDTIISDTVVAKIAGIAAQEVEGIQMGGGSALAVGTFLDGVTGGGGPTRGVSVQVGEEEAAAPTPKDRDYSVSHCSWATSITPTRRATRRASRLLAQRYRTG